MANEVKLLGFWASPFVLRARIALHMKSVDYELIEEKSVLYAKSELLLQSNPVHKKVPVLLHNGKPICESLIIVEYIDQVFTSGPSILPSDPYDLAIQRFWAAYIDDQWCTHFLELIYSKGEEARAAALEKVKEDLEMFEDAFVKCSKGKANFNGDTLGYLDIVLGSLVEFVRVVGTINKLELINTEKTPNLYAWAHRFCAHDAVKDCLPNTHKLLEFMQRISKEDNKLEPASSNQP